MITYRDYWLAPISAPKDGRVIIIYFRKNHGVYLAYWGTVENNKEGWCDPNGGYVVGPDENEQMDGWILAPQVGDNYEVERIDE